MAWHRPRRLCARREAKHRRQGGQALTPNTLRAGAHPKARQAGAHPENLAGRRPPEGPAGRRPPGIPGAHPGRAEVPGLEPAGTIRNHQGEDCPRNSGGVFHERRGAVWPRWRDRPDTRPPIPHTRPAGGHPACPGAHPGRAETPGVEPAPTPGIPGRQADTLRAQALTRDVRKPRESSQRPPPGYPAGRRTPCVPRRSPGTCGNPGSRASAHPRDTRPAGGHPACPGAHPGRAETPGVEPADTPGITGAGDCPRDGGAVCADTLGAQSGLGGGIASGCW